MQVEKEIMRIIQLCGGKIDFYLEILRKIFGKRIREREIQRRIALSLTKNKKTYHRNHHISHSHLIISP